MSDKKLFLGHKIRRLRRNENLTQAQMAEDLEISPAYLNLIERNQRPVTAQVLIKLASSYDLDLANFARDNEGELIERFKEMFKSPALQGITLSGQDFKDLAALSPEAVLAIQTLSDRLSEQNEQITRLQEGEALPAAMAIEPSTEVRNFLTANANFFPTLESLAQDLRQQAGLDLNPPRQENWDALVTSVPFVTKVLPHHIMGTTLRRFDHHGQRLLISDVLPLSSRLFQFVVQVTLIEHLQALTQCLQPFKFEHSLSERIARLALANYVAGAFLMPYDDFLSACHELRYDLDLLAKRFSVSKEQVAHRLLTLNKPSAKGVPLYFACIDRAGNLSKRLDVEGFQFTRQGKTSPSWHVHGFETWGERFDVDLIELADGARFISFAFKCCRTSFGFAEPGEPYAIALGCAIEHAGDLVYADGLDLKSAKATPLDLRYSVHDRLGLSQTSLGSSQTSRFDEHRRVV